MLGFIKKLFGNKYERDINTIMPLVDRVKEEYELLSALSHDDPVSYTHLRAHET